MGDTAILGMGAKAQAANRPKHRWSVYGGLGSTFEADRYRENGILRRCTIGADVRACSRDADSRRLGTLSKLSAKLFGSSAGKGWRQAKRSFPADPWRC